MNDYKEYLPELRTATLFYDMSDTEILLVLDAMQPPIEKGRPEKPKLNSEYDSFRMVIRSTPRRDLKKRRFKYDMPKFGEPGMLMAEIPTLSCEDAQLREANQRTKPPTVAIYAGFLCIGLY